MSTILWGTILLNIDISDDDIFREEKIKLGFSIIKIAAENEIGINLGDRILPWIQKRYKDSKPPANALPFELTNSSLNPNADALFAGDKIEIYAGTEREDRGESLDSRMSRIQKFFETILINELISKVIFHINSGFGEESAIEIKAREFKDEITKMYGEYNNFTPTVTFIFRR